MINRREHIVVTAEVLSDLDTMTALADGRHADPAEDVPLEELRRRIGNKRAVG